MSRERNARRLAVALLLGAAGLACAVEPMGHVVLVTVDTLRPDRIGAYGYAQAQTPNLDLLAAQSIRFERAYAHSSKTLPSIATLLTGQLPSRHGLYTNLGRLPEQLPTLATRFREAGFATAGFIGNYALRASRRLDTGFDRYTREFLSTESQRPQPENGGAQLSDAAIAWLEQVPPDTRLFLWVHYQEPHGPYTPRAFEAPSEASGRVLTRNRSNSGRGGIPRYQWLGHGRLAEYQARYDGEIREVDWEIGRLLDALKARGILESGVLVFASDHGEAFGEAELFCAHGEGLDDSLLRVPLLLRLPGRAAAVRNDAVRLIDIAPTLLELAGLDASGLPGQSLLRDVGDRTLVAQVSAPRERHWRRVVRGGYELREDRAGERQFLSTRSAESPDDPTTAETRQQLELLLSKYAPWPPPNAASAADLSDIERENLGALGYVD